MQQLYVEGLQTYTCSKKLEIRCSNVPSYLLFLQNSDLLDDLGHMKLHVNLVIADPAYMLLCVGEAIGPSGLPKFVAVARLLQNKN